MFIQKLDPTIYLVIIEIKDKKSPVCGQNTNKYY